MFTKQFDLLWLIGKSKKVNVNVEPIQTFAVEIIPVKLKHDTYNFSGVNFLIA